MGDRGLGVFGSVIRSNTATGTNGAGYLYNDWQTGDDGKEFRGLIVTPPAGGTLVAYEDGSFAFTPPADGAYSFAYRLFVDGTEVGDGFVGIGIGVAAPVAPEVVDPPPEVSVSQGSRCLTLSEWLRGVT